MKPKINKQRGAYRMADDRWLVPMIRNLVDQRPTYGYRRIQVLLSRKLKALDKPGVNHWISPKKVDRVKRKVSVFVFHIQLDKDNQVLSAFSADYRLAVPTLMLSVWPSVWIAAIAN
jgi:hypothetical protein